MRLFVAACCTLLAGSCGGPGASVAKPTASATERQYPALRWIPADASYAIAAARTRDLSMAARELMSAIGLLELDGLDAADSVMHRTIGVSLLRPNDLARVGVSLEGGAAVFSTGLFPTAVLPVEDADKLRLYIERRRASGQVVVRQVVGHEVFTWKAEDDLELSWSHLDGWLVLHMSDPASDPERFTWLERLLSVPVGGGLARTRNFAEAIEGTRARLPVPSAGLSSSLAAGASVLPRPSIVGLVQLDHFLPRLSSVSKSLAPCRRALRSPARILIGADVAWKHADGVVVVELTRSAAGELDDHVLDATPAGYDRFRRDAGLYLDWAVDLGWLASVRARNGCPLLPEIGAAARRTLGVGNARGFHVAAGELSPAGPQGRIGGYVATTTPGYATELVDRIFRAFALGKLRGLLENKRRIGGVEVTELRGPGIASLGYRVTPEAFVFGLGDGVIDRLLAPAEPEQRRGARLVAVGVRPGRVGALAQWANTATRSALGLNLQSFFERSAERLRRYESGRLELVLDRDSLVLRGDMRLP